MKSSVSAAPLIEARSAPGPNARYSAIRSVIAADEDVDDGDLVIADLLEQPEAVQTQYGADIEQSQSQ